MEKFRIRILSLGVVYRHPDVEEAISGSLWYQFLNLFEDDFGRASRKLVDLCESYPHQFAHRMDIHARDPH